RADWDFWARDGQWVTYTGLMGALVSTTPNGVAIDGLHASLQSWWPGSWPVRVFATCDPVDTPAFRVQTASDPPDEPQVGGEGADQLPGTGGGDRVNGGGGDDGEAGGTGADELHAGSGNDRVAGGAGEDQLLGGPGNDHLSGGPGGDELFDNQGRDVLDGG